VSDSYDVVSDTLQKHIDVLRKMSERNFEWGAMDFIRMDQIDQLNEAITVWKEHKNDHQTND